MGGDPYSVLGIPPGASDADVRAAYRRLVKLHHPDHNHGSPDAAVRFEAVQEAYAEIQRRRAHPTAGTPPRQRSTRGTPPPRQRPTAGAPPTSGDPDLDRRLADMERQVREARRARERAQRAAREAAQEAARQAQAATHRASHGDQTRPSDEELGYFTTDDSLAKILADARSELAQRYNDARDHPVVRRVSDLIAGLEELAEGLDRRRGAGQETEQD
jgi:hypothetical protein